jgi:hypothetical protein
VYPPKVTDDAVLSLIRELAGQGTLPSGAQLRLTLRQRYQACGGVARIYRLLAGEKARRGTTGLSSISIGLLEQENRNLREQLQVTRQREDAQQAHWNQAVGQLRARVEALEVLVRQAAASGDVNASLRRDVQEAEIRTGQLEVGIRIFGPASNRQRSR